MISHGKITHDEFDEYSQPLKLDLIALFSMMEEDANKLVQQSVKEKWTPDVLIKHIEDLI